MLRRDALRVELHPEQRQGAVAQPHDQPVLGPGCGFQHRRQGAALDDQAMVARRLERARQAGEDVGPTMLDTADLAVHRARRTLHHAAECLAESLVAETNAKHWDPPGRRRDQIHANSGLIRCAGTGREHDRLRFEFERLIHGQGVVALHPAIRAGLTEQVEQVEGEAVIVVDQQDHTVLYRAAPTAGSIQGRPEPDRQQREPQSTCGPAPSSQPPSSRLRQAHPGWASQRRCRARCRPVRLADRPTRH